MSSQFMQGHCRCSGRNYIKLRDEMFVKSGSYKKHTILPCQKVKCRYKVCTETCPMGQTSHNRVVVGKRNDDCLREVEQTNLDKRTIITVIIFKILRVLKMSFMLINFLLQQHWFESFLLFQFSLIPRLKKNDMSLGLRYFSLINLDREQEKEGNKLNILQMYYRKSSYI